MSIFSKKSRLKEPDDKSKQQQYATQTSKSESNRYLPKHASAASISNYVLSAGDRTVQRAQIMAASRKRMNSNTPDYSIKGASKSKPYGTTAPPSTTSVAGERLQISQAKSDNSKEPATKTAKTVPQKLSKPQKQDKGGKKSRTSSTNELWQTAPSTPAASTPTATMTSAAKPSSQTLKESSTTNTVGNGSLLSPIQRTPPLRMDSPTLGYTPSQEGGFGGFLRPQPSSDSGYGSKTPSAANSRTPSDANAMQEAKANRMPRIDSGFIPKLSSSKELTPEGERSKRAPQENKSLVMSLTKNAKEKEQSNSDTYVSRLDPGPTSSPFAEPVESAKTTMLDRLTKSTPKATLSQGPQVPQAVDPQDRGRSTSQKPAQSQDASGQASNQPSKDSQAQTVREMRSTMRQARRYDEEQPFMPKATRASTPPPAISSGVEAQREAAARTYTLPSSPSSKADPQRNAAPSAQIAPSSRMWDPQHGNTSPVNRSSASKPRDPEPRVVRKSEPSTALPTKPDVSEIQEKSASKPKLIPQPEAHDVGHQRAAVASAPVPPQARNVPFENETSLRDLVSSPSAGAPQLPPVEVISANVSERRSTLPPPSVLEGFKVNKRGHVLDEEGEVIGELFEGDIIDCVRQKANAYGDVVDEFGSAVGSVRTVIRGSISTRGFSISSATGFHPALATWQSDRRDSNVSQQTQFSFLQGHRGSVSHVNAPAVQGNVLVAELDASTKAEAGPVVDHSEIFSPFGAPPPTKHSTSSPPVTRTELAADERRPSQPKVPELKQDPAATEQSSVTTVQKPKKWTSRYFEPPPGDAQLAGRRYSGTTTPTVERAAEPKSSQMLSSSLRRTSSRAVIGPTLESLLEQESAPSSPNGGLPFAARSTPSLPLNTTTTSVRSPSAGSDPRRSASSEASGESPSVALHSAQPTSPAATVARPSSIQFGAPAPGLGAKLSVRSSYGNHQPARRSPLASYETTPPGSGAGNPDGKTGTMSLQTSMPRTYITKSGKVTVESDDAAPSPDIPMARNQEPKATANPVDSVKTVEKRKSRFSFMLTK